MLTGAFYAQAGTGQTMLLIMRPRCSIRGSELRYSELHAPRVFLGTQPHAHMP